MSRIYFFCGIFIALLSQNILKVSCNATKRQLQLLHVIFRHGARTPADTYPKDPFINENFYPVGWGHLTNAGKKQMYNNGKFIRERYNEFLGSIYTDKISYARATDSDRTIASAQLMCAAIWPPVDAQKWGPLNWQPIPVRSDVLNEDNLLLVRKPCAQYHLELDKIMSEGPIKQQLNDNYKLFYKLSQITGLKIKNFDDVQSLYSTLRAEDALNLTLPEWTKHYYPDVLLPLTEYSYVVNAYNTKLKRLKGGVLLRKLLVDWFQVSNETSNESELINELKSQEWIKEAAVYGKVTDERKIFIFGGHDSTITNLMRALNVWDVQNPDYGITVIFELWKNYQSKQHEVQIYLRNQTNVEPFLLTVPGCTAACPLKKLTELVDAVVPRNLTAECYDADYVPPELGGP